MEDPPNFNKRTILNKHTGWKNTKILINAQDGINAQCIFAGISITNQIVFTKMDQIGMKRGKIEEKILGKFGGEKS